MANQSVNDSFGSRIGRAVKRFVVTVVVLGLAGAVVFLLSQLTSETAPAGQETMMVKGIT
jgi:hypothetical protein